MIKILVADNYAIVRIGLKQIFLLMGDIHVAAEAASDQEVLDILRSGGTFDLLLLDMNMPGMGGVELVDAIRCVNNSLPILAFSIYGELQLARRILHAGASGFLTKGCAPEILMAAVRKVAAGGRFVDPTLAEQIIFQPSATGAALPHDVLSQRELHIMKLLAEGKSGNDIAALFSISKKTVSTHKVRLMRKMNFQSVAELVRYASTHALVECLPDKPFQRNSQ